MKSVSEPFRCRAGSKDWTQSGPWTITGAGTQTIRWKFIKDSSGSSGSDCLSEARASDPHISQSDFHACGEYPETFTDYRQLE